VRWWQLQLAPQWREQLWQAPKWLARPWLAPLLLARLLREQLWQVRPWELRRRRPEACWLPELWKEQSKGVSWISPPKGWSKSVNDDRRLSAMCEPTGLVGLSGTTSFMIQVSFLVMRANSTHHFG
jgi:hypothetical protein